MRKRNHFVNHSSIFMELVKYDFVNHVAEKAHARKEPGAHDPLSETQA
jgi:hypothetical protein